MIRTTRPIDGNKYFNTKSVGGYSTCIVGKPTDKQCNVLSNCVGYACGAFNEELNLGYEKYHLNCNAENFIERAIASGLSVVSKPVVGSILCWEGAGSLAGHVAIVTEIIDDNCIRTAESAYGGSAFYTSTRYNNNGRWGMNSNYSVRGFIINPNYPPQPEPEPKPEPTPSDKFNIGDHVIINGPLYKSANAESPSGNTNGDIETIITRKADDTAHPYNTTGDLGWMNQENIRAVEPKPVRKYSEGQRVVFSGVLYGDSLGNNPGQSRTNLVTTIYLVTDNPDATKPYNIDNGLGWVSEEDLTPYVDTEINLGDTVIVNGIGTSKSIGQGSKTRKFVNREMKVIMISNNVSRPNRYGLNMYNRGKINDPFAVTAWFSKDSIRK